MIYMILAIFIVVILIVLADSINAAMNDGSKWFTVVMMVGFAVGSLIGILNCWKDQL